MEIKDMAQEVEKWIGQFEEGYFPPQTLVLRLAEEVGEVAREVNHLYGEKPKKPNEPENDLEMELGDIIFILICMANSLNLDLERAFSRVMKKYYERDINRWTPKKTSI